MMHVSMSLEPLLLKPYMSEQEECGKGANRDLAFLIHKTKSSIQTCYKKNRQSWYRGVVRGPSRIECTAEQKDKGKVYNQPASRPSFAHPFGENPS